MNISFLKMYQRQVWKQLLSNKVLVDPRTQRIFKTSDLHDLFSLQESIAGAKPETENIFRNSKVEVAERRVERKKENSRKEVLQNPVQFDEEKVQAMRSLAQQIAKSMSQPPKPKILEDPKKEEAKRMLKTLTPIELREWNRKKDIVVVEPIVNKVDDSETDISFSTALTMSEEKAKMYKKHKLPVKEDRVDDKEEKMENNEDGESSSKRSKTEKCKNKKNKKKRKKDKIFETDLSGKVDGEEVEGLVKTEIKNGEKLSKSNQDDYVLKKLFSKSGVSTALQHDVIVQSGYKGNNSFQVRTEAQNKADLALKAIRKSRLKNWNW